ncbi:hypothetical protein EVG20_g612 [Dentipellis fragilis]|uniref:RRM domain-containing protein n=1 Tax=Dentipellis fragilis TaxID=205917 RepID=A0A4Y9ZG22_9AGAM|nr:hypothetical protein EVG20_g612 [Dentipellis fragilis]
MSTSLTSTAKAAARINSPLHVRLNGLPRTATPADIQRLLRRHQVEHVSDVGLDYKRFWSTGGAYVSLASQEAQRFALRAMRNVTFFTKTVTSAETPAPQGPPPRTRGVKGRENAATRGAITGTGERGGIWETEKSVILAGLPGKANVNEVRGMLKGYKLANGTAQIVKLDRIDDSVCSRVLVRLNSVSEAHRLVRNIHMTYVNQAHLGSEYLVHARIVL